ncbi:MAG: hypothetical protein IIY21_06290 [Clostridiales bacterium]|nr:hypothetical protein [Clostridiales bacterium]
MEYKIKMCTDSFNDRWKIIGKADSLAEAREQATMLLMAGIPSRKKELMIFKVVNGKTQRTACGFVSKFGGEWVYTPLK